MASLYKRQRSPFWWVKYRDGAVTKRESTNFRHDSWAETRRAKKLCFEKSAGEYKDPVMAVADAYWDTWVPNYLECRYAGRDSTLDTYMRYWRIGIRPFLAEQKIRHPAHLRREHCMRYVGWRTAGSPGRPPIKHNCAAYEFGLLRMLVAEAIRREIISGDPTAGIKFKMERRREKPEFTNEHLQLISTSIELEPEPDRTLLRNSFLLARYQGCRVAETRINPMADVRFFSNSDGSLSGTIQFRIKGDRKHTTLLHPELIPIMKKLQAEGATQMFRPITPGQLSQKWQHFLRRIGLRAKLPGACFHCFRVTAITRLARANVSLPKAMSFIGHSSSTIHRIYQRLRAHDLEECLEPLASANQGARARSA